MNFAVQKLEREIDALSVQEKLWLLVQIAQQVQGSAIPSSLDADLVAMAADVEIQQELRAIEAEFSVTQMDGLQ